jgi:hypothetical protein
MKYEEFTRVYYWAQQFGPPVVVGSTFKDTQRRPDDVWCLLLTRREGSPPYVRDITTVIESLEEFQEWILQLHTYLIRPTTELPPYLKRHFAELFEINEGRRKAAA